MIHKLMGVATRAIYQPLQPVRDEAYRRFIRSWPCLVCSTRRQVEAAHTGPHGIGQKASDASCIPLCREHHAEMHQGVLEFQERYQIDIPDVVAMFNAMWTGKRKAA
jgi:hypothetical protein